RRRALPLGSRAAGRRPRRPAAARRGDADQSAGAPRTLRRLPRVVPRLGGRGLLRGVTGTESLGAVPRLAAWLARRRVAAPGHVEPRGAPLFPAARPSLFRLRPARRPSADHVTSRRIPTRPHQRWATASISTRAPAGSLAA